MNIGIQMQQRENILSVFFLYSSMDRDKVEKVYSQSVEIGLKPWMDVKELVMGMDWRKEIQKAMRNCDLVFIFLSGSAISREGYFQQEIRQALELVNEKPEDELFILPIRLDNCDIPKSLQGYIYTDFSESPKNGWKELLRSINKKQRKINLPLSPQIKFDKETESSQEVNVKGSSEIKMNRVSSNIVSNAKSTNDIITNIFNIADNLLLRHTGDIEGIAASQIQLLTSYYSLVLSQAQRSFTWALIWAFLGVSSFIVAGIFLLINHLTDIAYISAIGGTLIEVISGINFYLYNKSSSQLAEFHTRLDSTQRILLANTICEKIEGDLKQQTRSQLALAFAGVKSQIAISEKKRAIPIIRISKINFNPEGKDLENEFIEVSNFGDEIVDITEWRLLDKAEHEFIFPKYTLHPRQSVFIWTKVGKDAEKNLFWNKGTPIWNNTQDCAYLKTNDGVLIDFYCYSSNQKAG